MRGIRDKWIGEKINTSGSYVEMAFDELSVRHGGGNLVEKLSLFKSRFGQEYYISDKNVLTHIDELLAADDIKGLIEYLYLTVAVQFGMIDFLSQISYKMTKERDEYYAKGKRYSQNDIRKAIGLTPL